MHFCIDNKSTQMLSFISWYQYMTTLSMLLVIYYAGIVCLYYRSEIMTFMKTGSLKTKDRPVTHHEMTATTRIENSYMSPEVHELLEELKELLNTSARMKTVKEELVMAIRVLLRGYPDLKDLPVAHDISEHMKAQCQHICSITLSDAEMKMLWNG